MALSGYRERRGDDSAGPRRGSGVPSVSPARMSERARHLIQLTGALRARFSNGEEAEGPGGGLGAAVDRLGPAALAGRLQVGEELRLDDPGVLLVLHRSGPQLGSLRVSWEGGPSYEEPIELPGLEPAPPPPLPPEAPLALAARGRRVQDLSSALRDLDRPLWIHPDGVYADAPGPGPVLGFVPPTPPSALGDPAFQQAHGLRMNYLAGAMAGGISSEELVIAMSRAGLLACFGAGGLSLERVGQAVERLRRELGAAPYSFNLLHNPAEPQVEEATVDLYLKGGVRTISASAYMRLTPAVVRFRLTGLREEGGRVLAAQRVMAKLSRPEVAEQFLRPAPEAILRELVAAGHLSPAQARMAAELPVAEDLTVEGDSGGHTDHRPLVALFPVIARLRDRIAGELGYDRRGIRPRVGAAGGLGDPDSIAAAFTLGADYVMTGSINQASPEAGTSPLVREMLAQAGIADCASGPAPDMFELGAQVQVLGRGSMWPQRAQRLYEVYRAHESLESIPAAERQRIETQILRRPLEEVWQETAAFWQARDPRELERARREPKHRMALTFRWYLGMSSRWARQGDPERKRDYQIWCGPAMGLFNDWARGGPLEPLGHRGVVAMADALMAGAALRLRMDALRRSGHPLPAGLRP